MRKFYLSLLVLSLVCTPIWAQSGQSNLFGEIAYRAQSRNSRDFYRITAGVGWSSYYGEVSEVASILENGKFGFNFEESNFSAFNLGLELRSQLFHPLSWRLNAAYYRIDGYDSLSEDSWRRNRRNVNFVANNWEFYGGARMDVYQYTGFLPGNRKWQTNTYIFAGLGFTTNNPMARYNGEWVNLRELSTEGVEYLPIAIVAPIGFGMDFRIQSLKALSFGFEVGYRWSYSDYLDDVSGNYPDPSLLTSPAAVYLSNPTNDPKEPGSGRGDASDDDAYLFAEFKVSYFFKNGILTPRSTLGSNRNSILDLFKRDPYRAPRQKKPRNGIFNRNRNNYSPNRRPRNPNSFWNKIFGRR